MDNSAIYDCSICGSWHPWNWFGDCRDDANRFEDAEDYADRTGIPLHTIEERTTAQRMACDAGNPDWLNVEEES